MASLRAMNTAYMSLLNDVHNVLNLNELNLNHNSARIKHLQLCKEELLAILAVSSNNQNDDDEDSFFLTLTTASQPLCG